MHKYKKIKPDEFYSNGTMSVARFKNFVKLENHATPEMLERVHALYAQQYPQKYCEIDTLIKRIRTLVRRNHPIKLLQRAYFEIFMLFAENGGYEDTSEFNQHLRKLEYFQSVIASTTLDEDAENNDATDDWDELHNLYVEIFEKLSNFSIYHTAYRKSMDHNFDLKYEKLYQDTIRSRLFIRGSRYHYHEILFFREFLTPHDDVIYKLWGIHVSDILIGLESIIHSLSKGLGETLEKIFTCYNEYLELGEDVYREKSNSDETYLAKCERLGDRYIGFALFDLRELTNWPTTLLDILSWEPGGDTEFFGAGDFSGWPMRELPTAKRPFIKYQKEYYCFDKCSLFDNLYRVLHRNIVGLAPSYKEEWNKRQQASSEQVPINILKKLLPEAQIIQNVYYINPDTMQWCECDGVLIYDDVIIAIEIKARIINTEAPIDNFNRFVASIKRVVEAPLNQGERLLEAIDSTQEFIIYNKEHIELRKIYCSQYRIKMKLALSVDTISFWNANLKEWKNVKINTEGKYFSWALSIDELRVYCDVFKSPLVFLHFLSMRKIAANSTLKEQIFEDEFDHIGLYLKYNNYTQYAREIILGCGSIRWNGFSQILDEYYARKLTDSNAEVNYCLKQDIPERLNELICLLSEKVKRNSRYVVQELLDFDSESRKTIADFIEELYLRKEYKNPIFHINNISITSNSKNRKEQREISITGALIAKNAEQIILYLDYTHQGKLSQVDFEILPINEIYEKHKDTFDGRMLTLKKQRLNVAKDQNGSIGRNKKCPCGSGKKYKKCCG